MRKLWKAIRSIGRDERAMRRHRRAIEAMKGWGR